MSRIEVTRAGAVVTVTINRPDKKNALTDTMYGALAEAFEQARTDTATRCLVVTGAGDVFTAGHDLADFAAVAAGAVTPRAMRVHRFLDALADFDKPLVAAVPGLAIGIGTTMLLHCDLVYLSETASLSTPFVDLGLVPEAASSLLLPARIGAVRAYAMFALGERIDAATAFAWGLANAVVAPDALQETARAAATALAGKPPGALAATKRLMREGLGIPARLATETDVFVDRLASPEAREAFEAFIARRPADFSRF
jgi:enoyl-CoA hydratase/carnithine racemase